MAAKPLRAGLSWLAPAGAAACVAALVAAMLLGDAAWRAWLAAAFPWVSAPIGALAVLMIMRLTPGDWAEELGPFMEAETLLLPLGALLILPILVEAGRIYPWSSAAQSTAFRALYLTQPMFIGRTVVWYAVLSAFGFLMVLRQAPSAVVACMGLLLLPLLGDVIATDWLLSLDPAFASSGFGLYVLDIQMLTAFSLAVIALTLSGRPIQRPGIIGGLLLTLLLLWGYFAFMHFVITWSDNLPPGVRWYQRRGGPWSVVMWVVSASRVVPTFLLFFRSVRRRPRALGVLSAAVVAGSVLESGWLALPAAAPPASGLDIALFALA
ncbi:MAG: hypothetical protein ACJ798_05295, partial [Phenylobacterium sp.]